METPIVKCPTCEHPINSHPPVSNNGQCCGLGGCTCRLDPNTIAVALLFGDLTQPPRAQHVVRQPDGSWA